MSTKGAENVEFNSDGTTSFTKEGKEYILNSEDGAILDESKFIIPEGAVKIINNTTRYPDAYSIELKIQGRNISYILYNSRGQRLENGGGTESYDIIDNFNKLTGSNINNPKH